MAIAGMDDQLRTFVESLNKLRGSVGELQDTAGSLQSTAEPVAISPAQAHTRDVLREHWNAIRDTLEEIATSPDIDGRTRARYARIDRRSYGDLIEALGEDRHLGRDKRKYEEAMEIWHRYRNGRLTPTPDDVARMDSLHQEIVTKYRNAEYD